MNNMFTYWRHHLLASTATVLLSTGISSAQIFVQPTIKEGFITGGNATSVENTGTGLCSDGSKYLHVSVWDGAAPAFGWSFNGAAQQYQKLDGVNKGYSVYDPDIVGYYDASGTWYMAAVYLARTGTGAYTVRYEVQKYDPSTNSWGLVTGTTRIDNGTTAACKSPNLDVNRRTGDAVIVFEQNGNIYARTRKFTGALTGLRRVACNTTVSGTTYTHYDPDVAAYGDNSGGTAPNIVSITYVTQATVGSSSNLEIDLVQDALTTIQTASAGCSAIPSNTQVAYAPVPSTHILERPRIAAPEFAPSNADPYDCIIAARYNDTFGDQIITMTRHNASYGSTIDVQQQNTLTASQPNVRPVVTYVGDGALLLWQYDDNGAGNSSNTVDILGEWLHWNGTATTGNMLIANAQQAGTQSAPSVEARGYTGYVSSNALSVWADDVKKDIAYKTSNWNSYSLRTAASGSNVASPAKMPSTQMAIYPNPAESGSRVELHLAAQEAAQALQVFEPRSGKVVATLPIEGLQAGKTSTLALPTLPAGLYVLRLTTDKGTRITRFNYQP